MADDWLPEYVYHNKPLRIFSKDYFMQIILPMPRSTPYILLYGDFKGLGIINSKFGMKDGDCCVYHALETIIECLPKNCLKARYGGDEYIFLIDSTSLEGPIDDYIHMINEQLTKNSWNQRLLTMDFAAVTCHLDDSLIDSLHQAEKNVENIKIQRIIQPHPNMTEEEKAKGFIIEAIENIFKTFRITEVLSKEEKENLLTIIHKQFSFLSDEFHQFTFFRRQPFTINEPQPIEFSPDDIQKIHSAVQNQDLSNLSPTLQARFIIAMSIEKRTGHYHPLVLKQKYQNKEQVKLLYFEIMGLKMANTLVGHSIVDQLLLDIAHTIDEAFESIFPSTKKEKIDTFDLKGGKLVKVLPDHLVVRENQIDMLNKVINSVISPNNGLKITCRYGVTLGNMIDPALQQFSDLVEIDRKKHRQETLNSPIGEFLVKKLILNAHNYLQTHQQIKDPSKLIDETYQEYCDTFEREVTYIESPYLK